MQANDTNKNHQGIVESVERYSAAQPGQAAVPPQQSDEHGQEQVNQQAQASAEHAEPVAQAPQATLEQNKLSLEQDKAQQKLKKKKKLESDEKHQSTDDDAALAEADDDADTTPKSDNSHANGNTSTADDSHKLAARKADGLANTDSNSNTANGSATGANAAPYTDKAAQDPASSAPNTFANPNKSFHLADNAYSGKGTASDAGAGMGISKVDAVSSDSDSKGGITYGWGLAGLALAGVAAAIGGGGGGGGGGSSGGGSGGSGGGGNNGGSNGGGSNGGGNGGSNGGTSTTPTTLSGTVLAGPVLPGVGLKVRAYAANGTLLGESNVSDNGTYSMTLDAAYKGGLVRIRLIDGNGAANDYWDEAAGAKDIGDLSAAGLLRVGQANTMMLTPLTTVADHKLEAEQALSGQALTEAQINTVNKALGDLFGVNDILHDVPILL